MKWKVGTLDRINLILLVALMTMVSLMGIFAFDLSQRTNALQVRIEAASTPKETPLSHPPTSHDCPPKPTTTCMPQILLPVALSQLATFPHLLPMTLAGLAIYQVVD